MKFFKFIVSKISDREGVQSDIVLKVTLIGMVVVLILAVLIPVWASINKLGKSQQDVYRDKDIRYREVIGDD